MSTRISEYLLVSSLLIIAGCDQISNADRMTVDPKSPDAVVCQVSGATKPETVCRSEVSGDVLTIRHPDGGFRRFRIVTDGPGLIAADGAESAQVTLTKPHRIALSIGGDHYDLPIPIASPK